jgi:hypothetical protein
VKESADTTSQSERAHDDKQNRLQGERVRKAREGSPEAEGARGEIRPTGHTPSEGGYTLKDDPNDLQRGELVQLVREAGQVFARILAYTFVVLLIATVNGSTIGG